MRILGLDIASEMGHCLIDNGVVVQSGVYRVKRPNDTAQGGHRRLGCWLRDMFEEFPDIDLVASERPMNIGAAIDWKSVAADGKPKFKSSTDSMAFLIGAAAVPHAICGCYQVRSVEEAVSTIRKHVVGNGMPKNPKETVRAHLHRLGVISTDVTNLNETDAVAVAIWASDTYDRAAKRHLSLT